MGFPGLPLFNPQQLQQMQQQMPQQPQAAAPDSQMDAASQYLMQQARGLPDTSQLTSQLGNIQQDMSSMAPLQSPQLFQPHFQPVTGAKSLLSDVGNALLTFGPGASAVSNINRIKQQKFENERQKQSEQLASDKARMEIPEKELAAKTGIAEGIGNLGYKQAMVGVRKEQADTQRQRVNDIKDFRQQLMALDVSKLNEVERHNKQDEMLKGMGVDVQRDRNNIILSLGGQRITVDQNKFDAAQANKEQGFFDQLGQALGLKEFVGAGGQTTPMNTQAPAFGNTPARPNKPTSKSTKSAGPPAGATHIATGRDGKDHYIDAQGKDLGVVNATGR